MHQTRQSASFALPIPRKGTTYLVRASQSHKNSVPVLIAVRDMLHLAQTAKEVQHMIKQGSLKLNGKKVYDFHESIFLFNVFEADKSYRLSILPTRKFSFKPWKIADGRLCKVVGKQLVSKGKVQLHLHDGSNVLGKREIKVEDSLYLDAEGKIKKHIPLEKGGEVFVYKGKHQGHEAKITKVDDNRVTVHYKGGTFVLDKSNVIAL